MIFRFSNLFIAFMAAVLITVEANAEPIGDVVSAVPSVNYKRGNSVQTLSVDDEIEQNDRVITTGEGSAYIHFVDDTVLTVGSNSEVLLDKFVFDGDRAKIANIQIVKGTLRFVTGKSDHSVYQIKTPVATVGVRGTTIDVGYENDRMIYNTVEGLGTVCHTSAGCQDVRAGSQAIAISRIGFARATPAEASRLFQTITRSHNILAQRIGRNPRTMLAFAKARGPNFARGVRTGLPKGPGGKDVGKKGFKEKMNQFKDDTKKKLFGPRDLKGDNKRFNGLKDDSKKKLKFNDLGNDDRQGDKGFDRGGGGLGGLLRRR